MEAKIEKLEADVTEIRKHLERIEHGEKSEAMARFAERSRVALHMAIGFDIGLIVAIVAHQLFPHQ